ncbi:MAG: hypothetical protein IJS90_07510 [Clostridia bacterium]|nr:hypothetical protein [Clostridia bacterium]
MSEEINERNIKPAAVHTVGPEESDVIYIPEPRAESEGPKRRFIKSDTSEFVSVREERLKSETETEVTKYTDRFVARDAAETVHTGHTGKIETYDRIHVPSETGKMIGAADPDEQMTMAGAGITPDEAPENEASFGDTAVINVPDSGASAEEDDLLSAPTKHIEPRQGSLLREIAGTADEDVRRNPDQLMMEGFDSIGKKTKEEIESDEELKAKLTKSREERIKNFRFWDKEKLDDLPSDATDEKFTEKKKTISLPEFAMKFSSRFSHIETPFSPVKCEEYADHSDRRRVFDAIKNEKQRTFAKIVILGALGLILLSIDVIAKLTAGGNNGFFTVFGGSVNALTAVNLLVLVVACVLLFPELKNGAISLLKLRPKADTLLLALMCSAVVQSFASFFTQLKIADAYQLLAPAAVIVAIPYLLCKMFYHDNMRQCFKTVSAKSDKAYLRKVTDPELKARIGCDGEKGKNTVYAGKTRFITDFPASGTNSAASSMPGSRITAAFAGVSLIVALIALIITKSFLCGVTALTLCLALCLPVCGLAASGYYIARANKKLSVKSSFIQSFDDAKTFSSIDNVVCDASEIFGAEITNCLTAKDVSVNQARFAAAATCAGTGSLMEKMFKDDIEKYVDVLPGSQDTVYEDRLGLSSYVSDCTVLLGNHDMLVNHNVELPDEELIVKFIKEDEKPLYLAMEGRFTALFAVKYTVKDEIKEGVRDLVDCGSSLLIGTNDSNITDSFAEQFLGIPENSVRIISPAAAKKLDESKNAVADSENASVVFTDSFESLCRCATCALKLSSVNTITKAICIGGAAASLILGAVLVFTGAFRSASALAVVMLQGAWFALCFVSPAFISNNKIAGGVNSLADRMKDALTKKKAGELPEAEAEGEEESAAEDQPVQSLFETVGEADEKKASETDITEEPDGAATSGAKEETSKEEPAAEDKEPEAPAEEQSVIDKATDDAVNEIFEKRNVPPKPGKDKEEPSEDESGLGSDVLAGLDLFAPKDAENNGGDQDKEADTSGLIASEALRSAFSSMGEFITDLSQKSRSVPETNDSNPGFSLFGKEKAAGKNADDVEKEYENRKEEEEALRKKFTAPDAPEMPVFDLKRDKKTAEPKFEAPLDTSDVNVFNDELFRRFEDDKIFAGLHEENEEVNF